MQTPNDLTTPEVWRDLQVFIEQYKQDRGELLAAIGELKTLISTQPFVTSREFELSQNQQDTEVKSLKAAVAEVEDCLHDRSRFWRQAGVSALASLVVLVVGALVLAGLGVAPV